MAKTMTSLECGEVDRAADSNRAVAVIPSLKRGRPVASVTVVTTGKLQTVSQPLD